MPSNTIPCSSCSRPLDVDLAPDGEIVCACGAVNDPGAEDAVGDATVDSPPPPESLTVEPLPANFAPPFSRDFLEQYVPMGLLGQGAMGAVYLMRQVRLDRLVAVKVVREDIMTADEARRLEREARTLASLNHPNILQLYDVGLDGRVPYMVCEYVEGETLAKRLGRKPALTLPQTLRIVIQVLDGLKAAHKKVIVHRDLKPGNIFLTASGRPKIGDFGLAKAQSVSSGTLVGKIMGTPAYMSPEQCRGAATTASSDVYAVGVILFEMACGRRPFQGPEVLDYLTQHTTDPAPSIRALNPSLPAGLDRLVYTALAKDPARRFDGARSFRKSLIELYQQIAPPDGDTPRPAPRPGARPDLSGMLLSNRYRMKRQLGEGGMGQVWLAADEAMDGSEVALKILPPDLWRDAEARETLKQEAKLSQKLAHPNIVRLMTLEPGDPPFLVMEFVAGPSLAGDLADRKRRGAPPYSSEEALPILEGLASGLDHAHAKNLVHRDLKPSNVLLDTQHNAQVVPKLADFGIAAELSNYRTRQTGAVPAGTLAYMSPEQLACQKLDARADVYSLGATLYQMLCLRPPFVGGDIAWAIKNEPVPEPVDVPAPIVRVLMEALGKTPAERPASAGALAARFRDAIDSLPAGMAGVPSRAGVGAGDYPDGTGAERSRYFGSAGSAGFLREGSSASSAGESAGFPRARGDSGVRRGPDMLGGQVAGVNPGSVRVGAQAPNVPWSVEAYALALVGALAFLAIWFHVGLLIDERLSLWRTAAQLAVLLPCVAAPALALWSGSELARRGLGLVHWLLLPLAVVYAARDHLDLAGANVVTAAAGIWLLQRPATLAFTSGVRPDDVDLRQHHHRGRAVAAAIPVMLALGLGAKLHLQALVPRVVPSIAWHQDTRALGAPVLLAGELKVQPPGSWWPQPWPPTDSEAGDALGYVFRVGSGARVAAMSVRAAPRSGHDAPGDVLRAAERLGRMRRRWHFKLERAAVARIKGLTWVECTGRYRTLDGDRAVFYAETTRRGVGYEVEFYGLPSFMSANRVLFDNVLASVELMPVSGPRASAVDR